MNRATLEAALRDAAEAHGLTFAPDPATHSRCALAAANGFSCREQVERFTRRETRRLADVLARTPT